MSPAHFSDYFNLIFMWSGAALFLLLPLLTFFRKLVSWNHIAVLISGSSALLFFIVFFILNPLLGPGIDWDLFATPGLVVLPFLVFVYGQIEDRIRLRHFAGPVMGLCLLGSTFMLVNANRNLLAKRMYHQGRWDFKTYWIGCSTHLLASADLSESPEEAQSRRLQILEDLQPYAAKGNDKEYAAVLLQEGLYQKRSLGNSPKALGYFEEAFAYSPRLAKNIFHLCITYFELGQKRKAYDEVLKLAKMKYPPYANTLKMAIHLSLEVKEYQSAANYAVTYLNRWQDDPVIAEVEQRLRTGDRISSLVQLFGK